MTHHPVRHVWFYRIITLVILAGMLFFPTGEIHRPGTGRPCPACRLAQCQ